MRIYLDHNAGAPLRPTVRQAMTAVLDLYGNPSSAHREGARVRRRIEDARARVAALIGARPADVIFTSGATEANNMALRGLLGPGDLLVTSAAEHASILGPAAALERDGTRVRRLGVGRDAGLDGDECAAACAAKPRLVSVALANGEVGALYDVPALARQAHAAGALMHTDAAQAAGRLSLDVEALGVDLVSLSGHKIGAPAGCGALWVRPGVAVRTQITGGPQERERRAGTENLLGIVGFGVAADTARTELTTAVPRMQRLRDLLWTLLGERVTGITRNGAPWANTLPNTLNVTIPGIPGESLLVLLDLDGIAASLGSACAAGSPEPSHVLVAMGHDVEWARTALRLSLGPETTQDDVDEAASAVARAVAQIKRGRAA